MRNTGIQRKLSHPGAMLREDFMADLGLSVSALAEALRVSRQSVSELIRERRALSADMALRLSHLFGNSANFWLNAQQAVDIWEAKQALGATLDRIQPLGASRDVTRRRTRHHF